jgi:hypothetical protein
VESSIADFAWPDFDRWQAFFAAADRFPACWDGLRVVPPPGTPAAEAYLLRKTALFTEWLDMIDQRARTLEHYTRQGLRTRIERQHTGQACPVCDRFDAREAGPDLESIPPFHPGCRCVLQAVPTVPDRRRSRTR